MLKTKAAFWAAPQSWASLITSSDVGPGRTYSERPVKVVNGVAVVDVCGVLMREEDDFCEYFGGASTVRISRQIAEALNDISIKAILLHINSPGGEVNGTAELAEQIFAARSVKPVVAYISGDGFSAGYWLASQASRVFIHNAAGAGALGVCYPVEIEAVGEEKTVWLVSNVSPKKHPVVDTPEAATQMQVFLNDLGAIFVAAVAQGRGVTTNDVMTKYGQGDIFIAAKAVSAGLCDEVADLETALLYAQSATAQPIATTTSQSPAQDSEILNQNQNTAAAGETTTQGENMADKTKTPPDTATPGAEMVNTADITVDWLKSNLPELYDQIVNEGAGTEAERQAGLDEMAPATEAEVAAVKAARKDRKQTAATLALAFHQNAKAATEARIKAEQAARVQDNDGVVIPTNGTGTKTPAQLDDERTIAAMKKRRGIV